MIVVLLPRLEVVLQRDTKRVGRSQVGEQGVRRNFAYDWETWRADKRAYFIDGSVKQIVMVEWTDELSKM